MPSGFSVVLLHELTPPREVKVLYDLAPRVGHRIDWRYVCYLEMCQFKTRPSYCLIVAALGRAGRQFSSFATFLAPRYRNQQG